MLLPPIDGASFAPAELLSALMQGLPSQHKRLLTLDTPLPGNPFVVERMEGVAAVEKLLGRIKHIVPAGTRAKLDDFVSYLGQHKQRIANALGEFTQPIRTILKVTAKRLDDHAWIAFTQTHNKHWIAPMSQQGRRFQLGLLHRRPPDAAGLPHPHRGQQRK